MIVTSILSKTLDRVLYFAVHRIWDPYKFVCNGNQRLLPQKLQIEPVPLLEPVRCHQYKISNKLDLFLNTMIFKQSSHVHNFYV
jgi:hypothetical protein